MNTTGKVVIAALIGLIVGAGGTFAFTKDGDRDENEMAQHMMPGGEMMRGDSMGMEDEMNAMTGMLQGRTGDAFDRAFLSEMIIHHEGAVQMAQQALKSAKHQEIKDLAQAIITAQNKEIAEMKSWEEQWYGVKN